jgi:hypothetical protein
MLRSRYHDRAKSSILSFGGLIAARQPPDDLLDFAFYPRLLKNVARL